MNIIKIGINLEDGLRYEIIDKDFENNKGIKIVHTDGINFTESIINRGLYYYDR